MDNLVLTRIAIEWGSTLVGQRLAALIQESGQRFRLVFATDSSQQSVVISLDPAEPWIGESTLRWDGPRWSPAAWVAAAAQDLVGRRLDRVLKDPADRALRLDFGEGRGLAIELMPNRSNLVRLGEQGMVMAALRYPKGSSARLAIGSHWSSSAPASGRLDPFAATAPAIDALLEEAIGQGDLPVEALSRRMAGVGTTGAELVEQESVLTGRSPGSVLRDRLDMILSGASEILIEQSDGASDASEDRLLPWRPMAPTPGRRLVKRDRPAATAALFHESRDAAARVRTRIAALGGILRKELSRVREAERKVREQLRSFEHPDQQRLRGEALLAGLTQARRFGDVVFVPDPYDPAGSELAIPAPPDRSLSQVADELFRRHRRFRRGLAAGEARGESLVRRGARLEALLVVHERVSDEAGADALETRMREDRLPVGLASPTKAGRARAKAAPPTLAGVRMITSRDGWTILIGRTGPDNDKLTFKTAAPDDFWLHAAGVPGAHVVILNPGKRASVPPGTLAQAAGHALWFSDARSQGVADVQWTRRKNVRRARGGSPGLVVLKRFETIRARAQAPASEA